MTKYINALLLYILIHSSLLQASPQQGFGQPYIQHTSVTEQYFNCDKITDRNGFWTCETQIDIGKGQGQTELRVALRYNTTIASKPIDYYEFKIPHRKLIRDTSFRGLVGLAGFFGEKYSATLNTKSNYQAYVKGQDVFIAEDIIFEVSETSSSWKIKAHPANQQAHRISSIARKAPDPKRCRQSTAYPGWQVIWSDNYASIEPAFKPISSQYKMVTGKFSIGKKDVTPFFREASSSSTEDVYITLFVDNQPIYQGQWQQKTKPTCCTRFINKNLDKKTLFAMAEGKEGMIMISRYADGRVIKAASKFDLLHINEAANKAIAGRFERSTAKRHKQCY